MPIQRFGMMMLVVFVTASATASVLSSSARAESVSLGLQVPVQPGTSNLRLTSKLGIAAGFETPKFSVLSGTQWLISAAYQSFGLRAAPNANTSLRQFDVAAGLKMTGEVGHSVVKPLFAIQVGGAYQQLAFASGTAIQNNATFSPLARVIGGVQIPVHGAFSAQVELPATWVFEKPEALFYLSPSVLLSMSL